MTRGSVLAATADEAAPCSTAREDGDDVVSRRARSPWPRAAPALVSCDGRARRLSSGQAEVSESRLRAGEEEDMRRANNGSAASTRSLDGAGKGASSSAVRGEGVMMLAVVERNAASETTGEVRRSRGYAEEERLTALGRRTGAQVAGR